MGRPSSLWAALVPGSGLRILKEQREWAKYQKHVCTHSVWTWMWAWHAQLFRVSACHPNSPAMADCTLDLWAKIKTFSPKLLFIEVLYHKRNKTRTVVILSHLFKTSSGHPRARSPSHLQNARVLVCATMYVTLGRHCTHQGKQMFLRNHILTEGRFQLFKIYTRIKGPQGPQKTMKSWRKVRIYINEMVKGRASRSLFLHKSN